MDDETDIEEMLVVSLSSEIVKFQSISFEFIEREVKQNLRTRGINADLHEEILEEVENKLAHQGVKIDYY